MLKDILYNFKYVKRYKNPNKGFYIKYYLLKNEEG